MVMLSPKLRDRLAGYLYRELVGKLDLAQFKQVMDISWSYEIKARKAKEVTKSLEVHKLADEIIDLYWREIV